jgi:DNA-binding MarR family transcriptional regulator
METKSVSVSNLESHIGYWLRAVSNRVSQAFAQKLAARRIGVGEWVALRALYGGDLAPSALAERLGMTRGAVTKITDRLAARRLIARRAGAGDGRARILALTGPGRALVPQLAALADRNDMEFFGCLGKAERAALEHTLKALARHHSLDAVPID